MAFVPLVPLSGPPLLALAADAVTAWTFAVAVLVFLVSWVVRKRASSKVAEPERLAAGPAGGGADPEAAAGSPYAPPASGPPPLPADALPGPRRWLKVPIAHYRPLDLFLIALVTVVFFGFTMSPQDVDPLPLEKKFRPDVLLASIFFQLVLMGMVVAFVRWRIDLATWLGLRWKKWPLALAIAPLTVFLMWCLLGLLFVSGWNGWLERNFEIESMQEAVRLLQEAKDPVVIALMAVAAVVVAPLTEEVIFRGYLYPAARSFCGPVGAILFSSLVFAAAHGTVIALLPLFILAVLLCVIYEATGSIWACIAVHFLFNAATVTIQLLARFGLVDLPPQS